MKFTKVKLDRAKGCEGCTKDCKHNTLTSLNNLASKRKFGCNSNK